MTAKTKHTRRPWKLIDGTFIYAPNSRGVNQFWCQLYTQRDCATQEELIANAKLMRAAPDLLEALQCLLQNAELFNRDTDEVWVATKNLVTKAINKATG